jgi:hypothetical protein
MHMYTPMYFVLFIFIEPRWKIFRSNVSNVSAKRHGPKKSSRWHLRRACKHACTDESSSSNVSAVLQTRHLPLPHYCSIQLLFDDLMQINVRLTLCAKFMENLAPKYLITLLFKIPLNA